MSQKACSSWESFLSENLFKNNTIDGVCLLSKRGCILDSRGKLENIDESDWKEIQIISNSSGKADKLELAMDGGSKTKFYVYKQTLNSLYAKSSNAGLIICRIPTGSLICSYAPPVINNKAILAVEKFADLLKL